MTLVMKLGIKMNVMGIWVVMQLNVCLCYQADYLNGSSFWKVIVLISIDCCFGHYSIIARSGGYNSTYLCTCVLYIFMLYFCVVLKYLYSLQRLLTKCVWQILGQTIKMKVFFWVLKLGMMNYLIICLRIFQTIWV